MDLAQGEIVDPGVSASSQSRPGTFSPGDPAGRTIFERLERLRKKFFDDPQESTHIVEPMSGTSIGAAATRYLRSDLAMGMSSMMSMPANYTVGAPNTVTGALDKRAQEKNASSGPMTGTMASFGAQGGPSGSGYSAAGTGASGDPWVYTQRPGEGRFRGGTASGGWCILPPEVSLSDYDAAYAPTGIARSSTIFMVGPGARFGAGTPSLTNGSVLDGLSWGMDEATADLVFYTHSAGAAGSEAVRVGRTSQDISWRSATAFRGTLSHAITADRTYTFPDASGTVALTGSTVSSITGTANQVLANGTSGSPQTGAVTLTTPQDIHTAATPQFARLGLGTSADANYLIFGTRSLNGTTGMFLDNTNTGAGANNQIFLSVDGTGNADAFFTSGKAAGGVLSAGFSFGYDTSALAWVLSEGGALGVNNAISVANTTRAVSFFRGTGVAIGTIGAWVGSNAYFAISHSSVFGDSGAYALVQGSGGDTFLNAASGQTVNLGINNSVKATLSSAGSFGIGTTGPNKKLDIRGDCVIGATQGTLFAGTQLQVHQSTNGATNGFAVVAQTATDAGLFLGYDGTLWQIASTYAASAGYKHIGFQTSGAEKMRLTTRGNLLLGTTTDASANDGKVLIFGDNAAKPTLGATTCAVYGKTAAGTTEVFVEDSAANETQISPHDPVTGEWVFQSTNGRTGKRLRVQMERLVKFLAEHGAIPSDFVEETNGR